MLELNDIKEALFEQEQDRRQRDEELTALKKEHERIKIEIAREKLKLAQSKEARQQAAAEAKIEALRAKEERQQELCSQKQQQAERQRKTEDKSFVFGLSITFLSLIGTMILFIAILIKG